MEVVNNAGDEDSDRFSESFIHQDFKKKPGDVKVKK